MPAFVLNPECKSILEQNSWVPLAKTSQEFPNKIASRAIDPRLRVLQINGKRGLIAVVGFLAMHNTTMSHDSEVYNADAFGVAETEAEQILRDQGLGDPIVTLFNGPEGDVSPMWSEQDRATCLDIGSRIARALAHSEANSAPVGDNINCFFAESSIANHQFTDDNGHPRTTSEFAEGGAALVAGAEDGRTIFNYDGHVEGTRFTQTRSIGEGAKLDMLALGFPINLPKEIKTLPSQLLGVPKTVPLGVARVGNVLFATLLGEFTTTMGRRIELAIKRDNPDLAQVLLIGLANEYLSYFATPEEYDSQQYEGASTLYGPASGPFVQNQLLQMTKDLAANQPDVFPLKYKYKAGPKVSFIPPTTINSLYNADDGLANILQDTLDHLPYRNFPRLSWSENWSSLVSEMKSGQPVVPRVWVEMQDHGEWHPLQSHNKIEDNMGLNFVTTFAVSDPKHLTWTAFWMPPNGIDTSASYRLCVMNGQGIPQFYQFRIPNDCPLNTIGP